ncbi:hypothetical protein [Rhodoplanes sp. Z2-YC6860]|uniref:hypothetical protein n=1 Tax=Rhodoplanes sp. Z2-YC6860 TaxID=674703 RepID=UPI000831C719|nr:hypothetical protein [Rhodoplanes sp. Z2-YC6860]
MADKVEVEIGGQSKYEVAHRMAHNILQKEHPQGGWLTDRKTYFNAVADAIHALSGSHLK